MNTKNIRKGQFAGLTAAALVALGVLGGCGLQDGVTQNLKQTEQSKSAENTETEQGTEAVTEAETDMISETAADVVENIDTETGVSVDNLDISEESETGYGSLTQDEEDTLHIVIQEDGEDASESVFEQSDYESGTESMMESMTEELQTEESVLIERIRASYLNSEEAAGAVWCIAYEELGDRSDASGSAYGTASYRESQPVLSASVIKVFIMGAVYDRICYPQEDMEPIGYSEGYEGELGDLLQQMITVSSNDAANRLVEILGEGDFTAGMQVVNDFCERHGYTGTRMGRRFLGSNENGDNYVCAADCRQILSDIYYGELVNAEASEKMLNRLKAQTVKHKIPSGLPSGFTSANKTGEMPEGYGLGCIENDMAIVFTPHGDYILVVLSSELGGRNEQAQSLIGSISSMTAQYYLDRKDAVSEEVAAG